MKLMRRKRKRRMMRMMILEEYNEPSNVDMHRAGGSIQKPSRDLEA